MSSSHFHSSVVIFFHSSVLIFTYLAPISANFSLFSPQICSRIGPDALFWPPLGASWPHLGHPLDPLGPTLASLGLPFAMPRPLLRPILVILKPQSLILEGFFNNFLCFSNEILLFSVSFLHIFFEGFISLSLISAHPSERKVSGVLDYTAILQVFDSN